jgi:SAM-dependent methyltransferase
MDSHEQFTVSTFDRQYQQAGVYAQRLYPSEQLIQFVAVHFGGLSRADRARVKVLEVGCGSGRNLWMLAKEGFAVYGIDASAAALDVAKTHLQDKWGVRAELTVAPFHCLPFPDGYFDAICDVVSLQHTSIVGSRKALKEIHRCLKPGGRFFSYRLSDASIMYRQSGGAFVDEVTVDNIVDPAMPLANNGQTSFWSPELARRIFQESGLRLTAVERHGRVAHGSEQYVEYLALVGMKQQ